MAQNDRVAFVIPCRNEAAAIRSIVAALQPHPVLVIDDGSTDNTQSEATSAGATVLRNEVSHGKGAALHTGLGWAFERGLEWAVCLDGDGQHSPADALRLLPLANGAPRLVIGNRMGSASAIPWLRRVVNRWMSARISELAGQHLPDTQCGLRLVPLQAWSEISLETRHFQYESEMLLQFTRRSIPVEFIPIEVIYRSEQSKISPWRDTLRWLAWWRHAQATAARTAPPPPLVEAPKPS